jgi:DNA-binding NtrC family response regulator
LPETDAQTGLALLSFDRDVQICMVDILMPGMSGVDVIEQALKIRPAMRGRIIVTTGFALTEAEQQHLLVELGCEYLEKPYAIDDLEELIWRLIEEKIAE